MSLDKHLVVAGFAKQSAKGTPASDPTYQLGLTDGAPANFEVEDEVVERTSTNPVHSDADRISFVPGVELGTLAHPKAIGLLLYAALGNISTAGAGPYTHTITPANDLPYLTVWGRAFDSDYIQLDDCKVDELSLSFENAGRVAVSASMLGLQETWEDAAWADPADDESAAGSSYFRAVGGTFKLDTGSDTPVAFDIATGELTIANGLSGVPKAASLRPRDLAPAVKELGVSMTAFPDDLTEVRKALTGTSAGSAVQDTPVYGSFEWLFTIDANTTLKVTATRVKFLATLPDADPNGGAVEVELEGLCLQPSSGDALTVELVNDVTSY